ncbi:MAG: CHAD domain-containing protein [Kiritimatiellia bacterium]|jgi:CHAD domain-containing protein|nr:CHAD domain-containing protein [Kiritimatiellia bacterium]
MAVSRPSVSVRRGEAADAALHRLLAKLFAVVTANEPRALKGSVPGLHDIRVALRRMRSLAMTFAPLERDFLAKLDKRASKTCDRMGVARDLDVWLELFRDMERVGGLDEITQRERRAIRHELQEARARQATEALECAEFQRVKKLLRDWLHAPGPRPCASTLPVEVYAARRMLVVQDLIQQRYRKVGAFPSKRAHDLRRAGRRMRYLCDSFGALFGRDGIRVGHWITKAQAALGKIHDYDNALELSLDLPTSKARAIVRRNLKQRRADQLVLFKKAWRHYTNPRLQDRFRQRLDKTLIKAEA